MDPRKQLETFFKGATMALLGANGWPGAEDAIKSALIRAYDLGASKSCCDDIRALGWTVAVHNDYRQNGEAHTFWLFTKDGRAVKGEGRSDAEALDQVRDALFREEEDAARQRTATTTELCEECQRPWQPQGDEGDDRFICGPCGGWNEKRAQRGGVQ